MYTVIQRYTFDPQLGAALSLAMENGLAPLLRKMPDFVAYYWLDNEEGAGAVLCIFEDQVGADLSLELVAAFAQKYAVVRACPPEIIRGKVKTYAVCSL